MICICLMLSIIWNITVRIKCKFVIMKKIIKNQCLLIFILLIINVLESLFLIAILTDGIVTYKTGFWINAVVMLLIFISFLFINKTYFFQNQITKKVICTSILIGLDILNISIYLFNLICLSDLFDGKTKMLLT